MTIWGDAEVQHQFGWGMQANAHIYDQLAALMRELRHNNLGHQCRVKVKVLQAQWVMVTDHNRWPRVALRSMPCTTKVCWILDPTDPGQCILKYQGPAGAPAVAQG